MRVNTCTELIVMQSQTSELVIGSLTEREEESRTLRSTGGRENLRRESAGNIEQVLFGGKVGKVDVSSAFSKGIVYSQLSPSVL